MVTAFGRGETLARSLMESGFSVRVLDFTSAFNPHFSGCVGPYPIVKQSFLPAQQSLIDDLNTLPCGLTFWLSDGPIELAGAMAEFYSQAKPSVAALESGVPSEKFEIDWLRHWHHHWTSPFHYESWEAPVAKSYPKGVPVGFWPRSSESARFDFAQFKKEGGDWSDCKGLVDVQVVGPNIVEIEAESKRSMAEQSEQWIWQLSSFETSCLNKNVAGTLFGADVRLPEWHWMKFSAKLNSLRAPMGMPTFGVLIDDLYRPWTHENAMVWHWPNDQTLEFWLKVPASYFGDRRLRSKVMQSAQAVWAKKLEHMEFEFDLENWVVNSAACVYPKSSREWGLAYWRNWSWISPEFDGRCDYSARLEGEAKAYHKLIEWRNVRLQKQGENQSDSPLHPL